MKQGKVWGQTRLLLKNPFCELHRLEAKKGTQCSKHLHEFKTNLFFVESGKLLIRVWKNSYDLVDETILGPGEYTEVTPNENHQFVALEDTIAFELYYPQGITDDIVRENVGGKVDQRETEFDS
jgi:quercetin dioxygenase-like cupin family protein